jgi:hypothetical protein
VTRVVTFPLLRAAIIMVVCRQINRRIPDSKVAHLPLECPPKTEPPTTLLDGYSIITRSKLDNIHSATFDTRFPHLRHNQVSTVCFCVRTSGFQIGKVYLSGSRDTIQISDLVPTDTSLKGLFCSLLALLLTCSTEK